MGATLTDTGQLQGEGVEAVMQRLDDQAQPLHLARYERPLQSCRRQRKARSAGVHVEQNSRFPQLPCNRAWCQQTGLTAIFLCSKMKRSWHMQLKEGKRKVAEHRGTAATARLPT